MALDEFCAALSDSQAQALRAIVERVCADPSGRREPRHRYTKRFHSASRYLGRPLPAGVRVWEFCPPRYRGLFLTDGEYVVFLKVRGRRFMTADDCAWH